MSIRHALYPYQVEPARAITDSVLHRKGLSFSVEIARQGGKNELSAQLEVLLLTLFMAQGGDAVKCSPTFKPQTINSMHRFKERLNDAGYGGFWHSEHGYIIRLGKARQLFFSADKDANVVGHTAHVLLEADEAQDIDKDKFSKDFRPMASTTNATTVYYGTAWDDRSLLEEMKQLHLEMEGQDGIRRHFEYDWQEVAKYNPTYLRYVEGERQRLGENHPLFLTQYGLKTLGQGGRLLSSTQLAQLQGDHSRQTRPVGANGGSPTVGRSPDAVYVAGIDVAGEDEAPEGHLPDPPRRIHSRRDSTVMTIARLDFPVMGEIIQSPQVQIVEHYVRTGVKHATLYPQLLDLLKNVWKCRRVVVDATGIGGGVAQFLLSSLGPSVVTPYLFTAQSKSKLAFGLLEAINAGRLKMYAHPPLADPEYRQFWYQMEKARSTVRANQTMNFYVDPAEGHDDYLISTALAVEAATAFRPRRARGSTRE